LLAFPFLFWAALPGILFQGLQRAHRLVRLFYQERRRHITATGEADELRKHLHGVFGDLLLLILLGHW